MKIKGSELRVGDVLVDPHLGFGPKRSRILRVQQNDLVGGVTIRYEGKENELLGSYVPPERLVEIEDRDKNEWSAAPDTRRFHPGFRRYTG